MAGATSPALQLASQRGVGRAPGSAAMSRRARVAAILALVGLLVLLWEAAKWLGGDPWRLHGSVLGIRIDY